MQIVSGLAEVMCFLDAGHYLSGCLHLQLLGDVAILRSLGDDVAAQNLLAEYNLLSDHPVSPTLIDASQALIDVSPHS